MNDDPPITYLPDAATTRGDRRDAAVNRRVIDRSTMLLEPAGIARERYAAQGLATTSHPDEREDGAPAAPVAIPAHAQADPRAVFSGTADDTAR
jgi:hypothetical protein